MTLSMDWAPWGGRRSLLCRSPWFLCNHSRVLDKALGPHLTIRFINFNLWVSLFLTFHTVYSYDGRERNLWNYEEKFAKCSPAKHALSDLLPLPSPWIFLDSTRNDITFFELKGWCCSLWASFDLQQKINSVTKRQMVSMWRILLEIMAKLRGMNFAWGNVWTHIFGQESLGVLDRRIRMVFDSWLSEGGPGGRNWLMWVTY